MFRRRLAFWNFDSILRQSGRSCLVKEDFNMGEYKTITKDNEVTEADSVKVAYEEIETRQKMFTPAMLKAAIADTDNRIAGTQDTLTKLQAEKTRLEGILTTVQAAADKVVLKEPEPVEEPKPEEEV
jgi:hypothetical protein